MFSLMRCGKAIWLEKKRHSYHLHVVRMPPKRIKMNGWRWRRLMCSNRRIRHISHSPILIRNPSNKTSSRSEREPVVIQEQKASLCVSSKQQKNLHKVSWLKAGLGLLKAISSVEQKLVNGPNFVGEHAWRMPDERSFTYKWKTLEGVTHFGIDRAKLTLFTLVGN